MTKITIKQKEITNINSLPGGTVVKFTDTLGYYLVTNRYEGTSRVCIQLDPTRKTGSWFLASATITDFVIVNCNIHIEDSI